MEIRKPQRENKTLFSITITNFWFLSSLILVFVVGYLWFSNFDSNNSLQEKLNLSKENESLLKYMLGNQVHFGLKTRDTLNISLYDTLHRKVSTLNDLRERKFLIFKVDETNCQACIDSIAFLMDNAQHKIKREKIVILVSCTTFNYLSIFVTKNRFQFDSYLIKDDLLPFIEVERLKVPYFFLYEKNKGLSHLFIPEKTFPKLTVEYFKTLESVLSQ